MPEKVKKAKLLESEVIDFFKAYKSVLLRTLDACKLLTDTIAAHPSYRKQFGVDDIENIPLYESCIKITKRWDEMEIVDPELETKMEDFGIDPEEVTCPEDEATEATCLLGKVPKEKKSVFNPMYQDYKDARRKRILAQEPEEPEEPNVVMDRRKAICKDLESILLKEFDAFKKADEISKDSPESDGTPKPKTPPVEKDMTTLIIERMAMDAEILYYAGQALCRRTEYSVRDLLDHLRKSYEMKEGGQFRDQPSKIIGREMDDLLKIKLCFEIMQIVLEERIKSEELFAECEKYYKISKGIEVDKSPKRSSRKRTTEDEHSQAATSSPAKQLKKGPESSQQDPQTSKLVDVPTPTNQPQKDVGTRRKPEKVKSVVISPPKTEQKGGSDAFPRIPPPPSKRSQSAPPQAKPMEVDLIDLNTPKHTVANPQPEQENLINFSPEKLPEIPPKRPGEDSDDENSTGVSKQLRRTSMEDK